ncbi:hypothetical protein ACQP1W_27440 [Spirillospora sp. CA-255316]
MDFREKVYVVRAAGGEAEVFSCPDDARGYARCKKGATVLERSVRRALSEASVVYERRLCIVDGAVRNDRSEEELFFAVGDESGIPPADVESFEVKEQWTVGLGTDRSQVDELIADEITRLTVTQPEDLRREPDGLTSRRVRGSVSQALCASSLPVDFVMPNISTWKAMSASSSVLSRPPG